MALEQPFSKRNRYSGAAQKITIREDAPENLRYVVPQTAGDLGWTPTVLRTVLCLALRVPPIHVHAFKERAQHPDVDETYGKVTIDGIALDPAMVRLFMARSVQPSVKDRVIAVTCPSCGQAIFSEGDLAFTPATKHRCSRCQREVTATGRLRNTISNPLPLVLAKLAKLAVSQPPKHDLGLLPETI